MFSKLMLLQDFKARSRFIDTVSTPCVKQQSTLYKKTIDAFDHTRQKHPQFPSLM